MTLLAALRADLLVLRTGADADGAAVPTVRVIRTTAWRVMLLLRITQAARRHRSTRLLAYPLNALQLALHGLDVAPGATIGAGVWFGHPVGCVIGATARIGSGARLYGSVTVGSRDGGPECPSVGRDVILGAGCRVLGRLSIGDRAVVAANSVVLRDVPADSVAIGIPAEVRPRDD